MYKYKVQVKKVSGILNESVLPSKSLVVKSKTKKSESAVLTEASKFFKKKYGLVIESADVSSIGSDTIMINSITLAQVKEWEKLVDVDNTGEDIQSLECYFLDEDGESCWVDEAVKVCFNAYDYDNNHDFDTLRSTLSKVGVKLTDGGYETEQGDFDGDLHTSWGTTKCCYGRMYSIIIPFVK